MNVCMCVCVCWDLVYLLLLCTSALTIINYVLLIYRLLCNVVTVLSNIYLLAKQESSPVSPWALLISDDTI